MSLEEKFHAAVNVIRSLPKSGSYQPSNELMLRFYSYFKQATEGTCSKDKPGFWDVVNRAKWEAWNKLGDMTKDDAMEAYVSELHKIVETMSYNSDVASFLSVDSSSFPSADLRLVVGDALAPRGRRSPASSCSESSSSSPVRSASPATTRTRHDSDDEFIDTVDVTVNEPEVIEVPQAMPAPRLSNGHAHQITSQLTHLKVLEQLPGVLSRLEADVAALRKAVEGDRRTLDVSFSSRYCTGREGAGAWRYSAAVDSHDAFVKRSLPVYSCVPTVAAGVGRLALAVAGAECSDAAAAAGLAAAAVPPRAHTRTEAHELAVSDVTAATRCTRKPTFGHDHEDHNGMDIYLV